MARSTILTQHFIAVTGFEILLTKFCWICLVVQLPLTLTQKFCVNICQDFSLIALPLIILYKNWWPWSTSFPVSLSSPPSPTPCERGSDLIFERWWPCWVGRWYNIVWQFFYGRFFKLKCVLKMCPFFARRDSTPYPRLPMFTPTKFTSQ